YLGTGFERRWRRSLDALDGIGGKDETFWRESHAAIAARLEGFVALVAHPDAPVRARASTLLGWFPAQSELSRAALSIALEDADPTVAGSAAIALAALAIRGAIAAPLDELGARLEADAPPTRAGDGAAIALAWLGQGMAPAVLRRLARLIAEEEDEDGPALPFHDDLGLVALEVYGDDPPDAIEDAVIASLESRSEADHYTLMDRFDVLIAKRFPVRTDGRAFLYEELRPQELAWLRQMVTAKKIANGNVGLTLAGRGLPSQVAELRRFLAVEPETLLHARRVFHHPDGTSPYWPTWRWLHEMSHREGSLAIGAAELARVFSPGEIVTLIVRHQFALRLSWELGPSEGHLQEALRRSLGAGEVPKIDPDYGDRPAWKTEPRVRDAMLDLWLASREGRDLTDADGWIASCLGHAPPAQPWLTEILEAMPASRRERIVVASLEARREGDLREPSEPLSPRIGAAPWLHLGSAPTPAATRALLSLVARVHPWDVPLVETLEHLATLSDSILDDALPADSERARELVRRARWWRARAVPHDAALRWEIRQWFRDGATLSSGESPRALLPPCAPCAQVFRELGIHPVDLGEGARGGILAPASGAWSPDAARAQASLVSHWQIPFAGVSVDSREPWSAADEDAAITLAIDNAIASRPDLVDVDRACVELRALSLFAKRLRAAYARGPTSTQ
ncbi:MAG: hypothetical protein JNL38_35770, partial [Myxococcales bacterium]|nr:hypothetical protein [Myxococcales bacterium]